MSRNPLLGSIKMPALGYGTWQVRNIFQYLIYEGNYMTLRRKEKHQKKLLKSLWKPATGIQTLLTYTKMKLLLEEFYSAGLLQENLKVRTRFYQVYKKTLLHLNCVGEDLYIVTKLPAYGNRPESVQKYFKQSLDALQVSYVDMYLVHGPFTFREVEGTKFPMKEDGTADLEHTDLIGIWKVVIGVKLKMYL